jgi:hypothetical protein
MNEKTVASDLSDSYYIADSEVNVRMIAGPGREGRRKRKRISWRKRGG